MLTDLSYALRRLRQTPGFSCVAILTPALAIGANSSIFSAVNALLLQQLRFQNPDRLVWVQATRQGVSRAFFSVLNFTDTREQSQTLDHWIAFTTWGVNLRGSDETERVQGIRISAPVRIFYDKLAPGLRALPGGESLGAASTLPMSALNARTEFLVVGRPPGQPSDVPGAQHRWVSPGYFHAMNIPLDRGREFTEADNARSAGVVVIDRALAERFFPNEDPIGQHILITLGGGDTPPAYEIVGIVESVKHVALTEDPTPTFYGPIPQTPKGVVPFLATNFSLVVRTAVEPEALADAVRRELRAIDPDVAVSSVKPMRDFLAASIAPREFNLVLLLALAATALLLAAVGIYGVIAFLVTQRTREIGVRLALGARRSDILSLILGHGFRLVLVGVAVGLLGAIAATRFLSSLLFNTSTTDPIAFASVAAVLVLVALLATYLPARRALKIEPMEALRCEYHSRPRLFSRAGVSPAGSNLRAGRPALPVRRDA